MNYALTGSAAASADTESLPSCDTKCRLDEDDNEMRGFYLTDAYGIFVVPLTEAACKWILLEGNSRSTASTAVRGQLLMVVMRSVL